MASSSPVINSHKRPRASAHGFSAESACFDFCDGICSSCSRCRGPDIIHRKVSPPSSSSSCMHPACGSSSSGISFAKEDTASSGSRSHELSAPVSSSASALTDTADSTIRSAPVSSLPHECCAEQELLCCVSSDEEAESCCGGNDTSEVDITGFLLHEVWDDAGWDNAGSEGGDAFTFDPETVFFKGANSTDCSEGVAFTGCSAENGNWFLNDLESEGHAYLNEVLDQEWMAAAVANLDRINDTLDADLCVLHLFEPEHAYQISD